MKGGPFEAPAARQEAVEGTRVMLTWEEELEAEALFKRGWTISAIARHLGRDRKTVRAYVFGERVPGVRRRSTPQVFEPFAGYVSQRLADDRHVWASTLFDEVVELGYPGSYPSFTRALRERQLRPPCPACTAGAHRESAIIDHPAGEEAICGIPHMASYEEPGNMRRRPSAVAACAGGRRSGAGDESAYS